MSETERLYKKNAGTADSVAFSEGLRSYMIGVYNYMALGVAATALIAFAFLMSPAAMQTVAGLSFIPFIALLALGWFAPRIIMNGSKTAAHGAYWAYVALWGVLIGPFVASYIGAGLAGLVAQAFFISAAMFAATSLYGYTTKKDLSGWGRFLLMASVGFIIAIVVNFFIASTMFSLFISLGVVLLMSAVTAYETQMIRNLYVEGGGEMNERSSIFGAFALYGSFITLFIHVLNILGIMRD